MNLELEPYLRQLEVWPTHGRHILAQFDEETIVVYQAYRPEIGHYAAAHGQFGGAFSYSRMSWIKPNFLWMMYRSGWGQKDGQEVTLAVRLRRSFFEEILQQAVPSSFNPSLFPDRDQWRRAVHNSDVRLQWDPDHDPTGAKLDRRAIQLGLRGEILDRYGMDETVDILDISDFVGVQRQFASPESYGSLKTPSERRYVPAASGVVERLRLDGERTGGT